MNYVLFLIKFYKLLICSRKITFHKKSILTYIFYDVSYIGKEIIEIIDIYITDRYLYYNVCMCTCCT